MNKTQHFKRWILRSLLLYLGYWSAASCTAFVFSSKVSQVRQCTGSGLRPMYDTAVVLEEQCRISETSLHAASLKFKNFDVMLDAFRDDPVLVYFSSSVCGSCHLQKKELVNIQTRFFGLTPTTKKKILMIDADHFPQICLRYDVTKLPCILLINNGKVLLRLDGFTTAEEIVNQIQHTSNLEGFCP